MVGGMARGGKDSEGVARGVHSCLGDSVRSREPEPWATQASSPAETVDSPGGGGDCSISGRLLWHEMKGLEWGCWQTDRRGGWRRGVGGGR